MAIEALASGVASYFPFVFVYYEEGAKNFGMMGREATPLRSMSRRVAGPYVDYACTNEYAVTLSMPVPDGDDLLGVAAADVLVSSLETRVLPALTDFE